jgi:hypothetical protein
MAKKKVKVNDGVVLFDVVYEDGARSSRRKVSAGDLEEHGESYAKTAIMDQDREIAARSGNDRGPIQSISRSTA